MTPIYQIIKFIIAITALTSCTSNNTHKNHLTPIQFLHPHNNSEYTLIMVTKGADRAKVEALLIRDQVGSDALASVYEKNFNFIRINSEAELEEVLKKYFGGGDVNVRKLWAQYPNATYSGLEADNYVIVFFDTKDEAVTAWPQSKS